MGAGDLDLCYMSAIEALAAFKARTLSPVELMKAVIARCEAVNPALNLVTYSYFDRALEQAKAAEARYGKTDGRLRAARGAAVREQGLSRDQGRDHHDRLQDHGAQPPGSHIPGHRAALARRRDPPHSPQRRQSSAMQGRATARFGA